MQPGPRLLAGRGPVLAGLAAVQAGVQATGSGAAAHAVSGHDVDALRDLCARKAGGLGQGGVRGHAVGFSVTAWDEPPGLPDWVSRTGRITPR